MGELYTISKSLWVDTSDPSFKHDQLFVIRDPSSEVLVDVAEIPALIEALQTIAASMEEGLPRIKKLQGDE